MTAVKGRRSRYLWPCLLLLSAVAAEALQGCSSEKCSGNPITCYVVRGACDQVPGCVSQPGCVKPFLAVAYDCRALKSETACVSITTAACAWGPDGCGSVCPTVLDEKSCRAVSYVDSTGRTNSPCRWSTCSGIPEKKFCNDYPVNQCPSFLGCFPMTATFTLAPRSDPIGGGALVCSEDLARVSRR